jgi:ankyrin repeat protein
LAAVNSSESKIQGTKIIKILLEHGANPNFTGDRGCLVIQMAILKNESSVALNNLQLLLQNGGNPNIIDETGRCLVHYAAENVSETAPEKMKIILENGGDVNICNKIGETPMHYVAMNSGIHAHKLLRILFEHGGDPKASDYILKQTPLHRTAMAAIRNENHQVRFDITSQLLEKGGNPNAADFIGWTPVHYGISTAKTIEELKMLKLLLEHGGNILQEDKCGFTPYHISIRIGSEHCHPEVKKHIEKTLRELIFRACCAHINATSRHKNVNQ